MNDQEITEFVSQKIISIDKEISELLSLLKIKIEIGKVYVDRRGRRIRIFLRRKNTFIGFTVGVKDTSLCLYNEEGDYLYDLGDDGKPGKLIKLSEDQSHEFILM